jgi:hypothetical protein
MKPAIHGNDKHCGGCTGKGYGGLKCHSCYKPYTKKTCARRARRNAKQHISKLFDGGLTN